MTTIRVMTYNVRRCRGRDGRVDPDRTLDVIAAGAPDIVALQEVDADQLGYLAERLGMRGYGNPRPGGNAFLSYHRLNGIREYDLGGGACCLQGDADIAGRRVHLFDVRLSPSSRDRHRQIISLLGPELLGNRSLPCPVLVLGDFADLLWGVGNMRLSLALRKSPRLLWNGTYPARLPLVGRDRAYLRGDLRVVDARILRTSTARHASSHLPLILTVQVTDPRTYLRVEKLRRNRMEIAPG